MDDKRIDDGSLEEVAGGMATFAVLNGKANENNNITALETGNTGGGQVLLGGASKDRSPEPPSTLKTTGTIRTSGGPISGGASAGLC